MNDQSYDDLSRSPPGDGPKPHLVDAPFVVRAAIIGIFLILFIAFLEQGSAILVPIVSAVVIGIVLEPLSRRAERLRIPRVVFATAVVVVLLTASFFGLMVLSKPIVAVVNDAPQIGAAIEQRLEDLKSNFAIIRYLQGLASNGLAKPAIDLPSFVKPVLGFLTPALGQLVIFVATLFLFLIDQSRLRHKLVLVFAGREARLHALHVLKAIDSTLIRYLGTVTLINLAVGVVSGIGFYLLGMPNPVFWGTAAFICNFLPYLGPALMVVALGVVGLITFSTVSYAILIPSLYVALMTVEGQFVTPNIVGHNIQTGALAALLSLAFWTWLWGPVGAFLALPLLIVGAVIVRHLTPSGRVDLPA